MMKKLTEVMREKPYFYAEQSATFAQIEQAEEELGLKFAKEYKEYVLEYGAASFDGHELTGFSDDEYLCVVNVTEKNRKVHKVNSSLYVVEGAHIDGIVVWQDSEGYIYETSPGVAPKKIANSLIEYIE